MKKLIVLLAAAIAVVSCGGGGGGSGGSSDSDAIIAGRHEPEMRSVIMFRLGDLSETPIMTAEVGEELIMFFCFCDPNGDVSLVRASLYYPPNASQPFEVEFGQIDQTERCECWYWGVWVPTPPIGEYLEPFVITQTNTNFDYMTEALPEKKLWKEE
jgi:hypothetical protein